MNELEDAKKCLVDGIPEVKLFAYYILIISKKESIKIARRAMIEYKAVILTKLLN